jgi:heme exporter protein CcmD
MNEIYIWGSYIVTFACLAVEIVLLWKRARETKA